MCSIYHSIDLINFYNMIPLAYLKESLSILLIKMSAYSLKKEMDIKVNT